jgi:hypothetical protein
MKKAAIRLPFLDYTIGPEAVSIEPGISDHRGQELIIGSRTDLKLDRLAFTILYLIDDNLECLFAIGATHALLGPCALLEFRV